MSWFGQRRKRRGGKNQLDRCIRRIIGNDPTLTFVDLGGRNIGDDGAKKVAEALRKNRTVTQLKLWNNSISAKGVRALADMLQHNTTLTTLNLLNNSIGREGARVLAEVLGRNATLAELCLGGNEIGNEGVLMLAEGLKNNSTLAKLWLMGNSISEDGARALAEVLRHNTTLATLDLEGNDICAEGARALAEELCHNSTLAKLYLKGNCIGVEGARSFAEGLQHNTTLTALWLDENSIGTAGALAMGKGLRHSSALAELYLEENSIGAEGARAMGEGLRHNITLRKLRLNDNSIGTKGAQALAEGLCYNATLTMLDLSHNNIGCEGAEALVEGMCHNITLTALYLDRNGIDYDVRAKIFRLLQRNKQSQGRQGVDTAKFGPPPENRVHEIQPLLKIHGEVPRKQEDRQEATQIRHLPGNQYSCRRRQAEKAGENTPTQRGRVLGRSSGLVRTKLRAKQKYKVGILTERLQCEKRQNVEHRVNRGRVVMHRAMTSGTKPLSLPLEYLDHCTNKFSYDRMMGEGSFGEVYLGTDVVLHRRFAVKRLKMNIAEHGDVKDVLRAKASFKRELEALSRFRQPNISRLYAYFLAQDLRGSQCLVFEYAANGSLKSFLKDPDKRDKLHWTTRIQIARDISRAVRCLHQGEGGYVCFHMDINPANVCLKKDFSALLIDCGLSKLEPADDSSMALSMMGTSGTRMKGTQGYICPEYAEDVSLGRGQTYESSCDIFSLGIVFIELFTGVLQMSKVRGEQINHFDLYSTDRMGKDLKAYADRHAGKWEKCHRIEFATLASKCIAKKKSGRPNICEIASLLGSIASSAKPWSYDEKNAINYVFSDPLVWQDNDGVKHRCEPRLDYARDVALLKRCIEDSQHDIKLSISAATWKSLQEHASKRCGCLHISCHGLPPAHIMLEDDVGGARFVSADELSDLLKPFPEPFKFVFVAACHSEIIGKAFVEAGVRHVLCCELNSRLLDDATADFTGVFYGALAKGYTIKHAYDVAERFVSLIHRQESDKFILLPDSKDHSLSVFDADKLECNAELKTPQQIPSLTTYVGCEEITHEVICALLQRKMRLVTVFGERISGRTVLACAVSGYIRDRLDGTFLFDDIVYVNGNNGSHVKSDQDDSFLHLLCKELTVGADDLGSRDTMDYICNALAGMKALVVLDGFDQEDLMKQFLAILFNKVEQTSILLTAKRRLHFSSAGVVEEGICLD